MVEDSIDDVLDGLDDEVLEEQSSSKKKKAKKKDEDEEKALPDVFPTEFMVIPVASITEKEDSNTREVYDDDETSLLINSIADNGLYNPIAVTDNGDGTYKLHDGSRRLYAVKKLNIQFVPAVIHDPEKQDTRLIAAIGNFMRKDMNAIEEANMMKVMMDQYEINQDDLSNLIGKSQGYISQKLSLLKAVA